MFFTKEVILVVMLVLSVETSFSFSAQSNCIEMMVSKFSIAPLFSEARLKWSTGYCFHSVSSCSTSNPLKSFFCPLK